MRVEMLIRDEVLMDLVDLARADPEFKRRARADLEGALHEYGYELTADELAAVKEFHRRTLEMSDAELNRTLAERASSAAMRGG
jgi:histone H3/H4